MKQTRHPETLETADPRAGTGLAHLVRRVGAAEVPESGDLCSPADVAEYVAGLDEPPLSLIVVGDIMLGGRAKRVIAEQGIDYPFAATVPLFRRAHHVVGNLEGPLCSRARREERRYSYKVRPALAASLKNAGVDVATMANNHLLDCGREGVLETLVALQAAGVAPLGAGSDEAAAHAPVIVQAGRWRLGLLGYYWNRRCAATAALPGSAMDQPELLEADIRNLRHKVDRIVVTIHWGVPYVREPSAEDRAKARLAIDAGADAVVGHHPHIVQPFEIYRDRPIIYSVGNFMLGSGNSRAEGMAAGLRFDERRTDVELYPLYVKNRDPRVHYQPKLLRDQGARRVLESLRALSGPSGEFLDIERFRGRMQLSWSAR